MFNRKIIHIDMDCFYAAVEERDKPSLKDKPVAVGGSPSSRGVLCTCNYEARKYGLHAAMASGYAIKLCPQLIIVRPNMQLYSKISKAIRSIFYQFTNLVEPLSLDEAFLDVTNCEQCKGSATLIAQEIRKRIYVSQRLTASAGVAPNKFLAKVASDWRKPNGIFVITPEQIADFMRQLPVKKIFGVGKVTAAKLANMNVSTCRELQQIAEKELIAVFGNKFGSRLYQLARGIDDRPVEPKRERKSLSVETTFANDLTDETQCLTNVNSLYRELKHRLQKVPGRAIHKQFVKIKFSDFTITTKECLSNTIAYSTFIELFKQSAAKKPQAIRLIGLGVRFAKAAY